MTAQIETFPVGKRRLAARFDHVAQVEEGRGVRRILHPLPEIVFLVVCGTIADCDDDEDDEDIAACGAAHLDGLREHIPAAAGTARRREQPQGRARRHRHQRRRRPGDHRTGRRLSAGGEGQPPTLRAEVEAAVAEAPALDTGITLDKAHRRIEQRRTAVLCETDGLAAPAASRARCACPAPPA